MLEVCSWLFDVSERGIRNMKKNFYFLFILILLAFSPSSAAYAEQMFDEGTSVFLLPSSLQTIEDEAFSGTNAEAIVFPDGFTSLGANAFEGNSALTDAYIPPTTEYIADTAFPMNPGLVIHGAEDSYAQEWAKKHHISFVVEDIWKAIVDHGKTVRIREIGLAFLALIVIPKKIIKIGSRAEDESLRPKNCPELYPIEYSFP